jgi:hypothetical protein
MTVPEPAMASNLSREQAISAASASVRRLFTAVSEQQARGVRLVQGGKFG